MEYDFAIIGSGFGGSVSALRLAEKGYKVAVIEKGRNILPEDMEEASKSLRKLMWMPSLGMHGFFTQNFYRHLSIVGGVGVGGGSLVYAAVLLRPGGQFYIDPSWRGLGIDWKRELKPHYDRAAKMLGVQTNPSLDLMDRYLKKTAKQMKAGKTFGPTPNGIYFGRPEEIQKDPYFGGTGPSRAGCHLCGECLTGCKHGSKNSLDKNYLYLARRLGAAILPERKVTCIMPQKDGTYLLKLRDPRRLFRRYPPVRAKKVIIAAGVLGTLELLFRCRDITGTLPGISEELGRVVRTNSESIVGALSPDRDMDLSKGTTISSHFYPDEHTHITQNRFPRGYTFMKWYCGPLVDGEKPLQRSLKALGKMIMNPTTLFKNWFARNWHRRVVVLTVMQDLDNRISFRYGRSLPFLFLARRLKSKRVRGKEAPTYLPVANRAARSLAGVMDGAPVNVVMESLMNQSTTAHILGGCHMGSSPETGVIGTDHQVYGYPGLYVIDGSAITANVGVNPSLTIAALAERAMGLVPDKKKSKDFLKNNIVISRRSIVMKAAKKIITAIGIILLIDVLLTGINIAQKGCGGYKGQTMEQILGVPADKATVDDVTRLSRSQVMQLFYAAPAPKHSDLRGEYSAQMTGGGVLTPLSNFYAAYILGPGRWCGKAFLPAEGSGYNIFQSTDDGKKIFRRAKRMDTSVSRSLYDGRESFHVDYSRHMGFALMRPHDEIRKINDTLYLGMGSLPASAGRLNPMPFVVYGGPKPWVGPDDK